MPETPDPLDESAVLKLAADGRTLAHVEHRPTDDLDRGDTAALVATLRGAADALERHHLNAPADEVLARIDPVLSVTGEEVTDNPHVR